LKYLYTAKDSWLGSEATRCDRCDIPSTWIPTK
jgi:hypothetical protein